MKATGISIYRVIVPVLVIAAVLAAGLFLFDESYLPGANRRQEALLSVIKGKPAQTFLRPDQKWIFGLQEPGRPGLIYYYQFFDPDHDRFANISVFEFDPDTFSLTRRIFADTAHWDPHLNRWIFEDGWDRHFQGEAISSYDRFSLSTFATLTEQPSYFKKENRQSSEMSFIELSRYIHDLRQSGFDTMRLRVQLDHKIAYPLITLIMAVLAVPFALSMGKRGSLAGIAAAIAVAIAYWVVAGTFEAMGNVNMLPAFLAPGHPTCSSVSPAATCCSKHQPNSLFRKMARKSCNWIRLGGFRIAWRHSHDSQFTRRTRCHCRHGSIEHLCAKSAGYSCNPHRGRSCCRPTNPGMATRTPTTRRAVRNSPCSS